MRVGYCYNCGKQLEGPAYRSSVCPHCGKDVKVCLNCRFYSPGKHLDCAENIGEPVKEKDRANFCDFFQLSPKPSSGKEQQKEKDARAAFDDLFS